MPDFDRNPASTLFNQPWRRRPPAGSGLQVTTRPPTSKGLGAAARAGSGNVGSAAARAPRRPSRRSGRSGRCAGLRAERSMQESDRSKPPLWFVLRPLNAGASGADRRCREPRSKACWQRSMPLRRRGERLRPSLTRHSHKPVRAVREVDFLINRSRVERHKQRRKRWTHTCSLDNGPPRRWRPWP